MIVRKVVFGFALATVLISCKNDKVEALTNDCPELISFSQDLEPMFTTTCSTSGCHDATASAGYNLLGYSNIEANAEDILPVIRHESGTPMPFGGDKWPDSTIQKLQCWIEQGKLDN